MKIKLMDGYDEKELKQYHKLAQLMDEVNEKEYFVFVTIVQLLKEEKAEFFMALDKKGKVGYGLLLKSPDTKHAMKLLYFAIEKEFRGRAVGNSILDSLNKILKRKLDFLCLNCGRNLENFYIKSGFRYLCETTHNPNALNQGEDILMQTNFKNNKHNIDDINYHSFEAYTGADTILGVITNYAHYNIYLKSPF